MVVDVKKGSIPREHKVANFSGEYWAMERARENEVPVPRIFVVDETRQMIPVPYMIQERLPGECLAGGQNTKISAKLANEMGSLLKRIHEIPTENYGRIDGNGFGRFVSWRERMENRRTSWLKEQLVNSKLADKVCDAFTELSKCDIAPYLVHGDYFLGNLLVQNDKIVGVIDFNPLSGSSYFDIGNPAFNYGSDLWKEIENGYGMKFDNRLLLLNRIDNIAGKLPNMVKMMPQRAEFLAKKLEETVKEL